MVLGHQKRLALMASIATKALSVNSGTRLQALLDEGDLFWFTRNPDEHQRIRFHFRGEHAESLHFGGVWTGDAGAETDGDA